MPLDVGVVKGRRFRGPTLHLVQLEDDGAQPAQEYPSVEAQA